MSMQQFLHAFRSFDGVLELAPTEGSAFPEIAWGDHFFYYAPDGKVPSGRPYATFVTKDYPGDTGSGLDAPGRWRINVHVGKKAAAELVAGPEQDGAHDFGVQDVFLPHPLYADQGWIAVVDPGPDTTPALLELVRGAHRAARERVRRRNA